LALNRWIITSGLAGALAVPLLVAPATASASCYGRQVTGTVVGGVGGALIGNSISRGGAGAVLGGLGGAVLGHEVARSTCRHERYRYRHAEYDRERYRPYRSGYGGYQGEGYPNGTYAANAQYGQAPPQPTAYYDSRGNLVYPAGAAPAGPYPTYAAASPAAPACNPQSYYDDRGELVQTCAP
jgi:hypothetical protein